GVTPRTRDMVATPFADPETATTHEPTLIGEVTLNIRSMFRNRAGRPRSEINSGGLTPIAPNAANQARRASTSLPRSPDRYARPAEAPATPPVKKYAEISHVQVGCLITGWPWYDAVSVNAHRPTRPRPGRLRAPARRRPPQPRSSPDRGACRRGPAAARTPPARRATERM